MKSLLRSNLLHFYFQYATLVLIAVLLFYSLSIDLVSAWRSDPQFSHGFLIPAISLFIIWSQRRKLRVLTASEKTLNTNHSGIALILLLFGLSLFIIGKYTFLTLIEGISFIVILSASILFVYGLDIFKVTLFPVLYLLFMIPFPARVSDFFSEPLQYWVAAISAWAIGLTGAPVFLDGDLIYLPSITLQVEEVCAGLRTLLAFSAIGLLFAYLYIRSLHYRIIFLTSVILLALFINVLRVSSIGIFAYLFGNNAGMTIHHYGWTFVSVLGFSSILLTGWAFKCMESGVDCRY